MLLKMVLTQDEILTPKQLAERLHVSVYLIQEQLRARTRERLDDPLPFHKVGKFVRFNWREVCEWQTRHEVKGGTVCVTNRAVSGRTRNETRGTASIAKSNYNKMVPSNESSELLN